MSAATSRMRRDLQGLRAIAVLAVVATHLTGWPRGGFVGVDVFFVLSGFLVTGILLRDLQSTGSVRLRSFFARRVRRLLPAALLVLAVTVAAGFALFPGVRAERLLGDALAAVGLASNWRFALEGRDYFSAVDVSPLQHFWSLSVEEQFSLFWPFLVLLAVAVVPAAARRGPVGRVTVGSVAALVVVASAVVAISQTSADPALAYFSTLTRAGELAAGAVLAAGAPILARIPAPLRGVLAWIGVGVVCASFLVIDPSSSFPAPWVALPVAGAALVIAAGVGGDPRHRHLFVLTTPLPVAIGDVSYSLYLWHLPVIVFAGVLLAPGAAATALTVLVIAVLTVATYLGVEQPLHRSPWLTPRSAPNSDASSEKDGAVLIAPPVPAPARAPAVTSRPAGWVPGQRYYPGSRPVSPMAPAPQPATEIALAAPVAVAASSAPAARPDPDTGSWTRWRARFAPRMGLAVVVLVIGAGATVLVSFVAYGAPALPLPIAPVAGGAPADSGDTLAGLQSEIAAATAATTWPELHPTLDDAMRASSTSNRAHDCFTPDPLPGAERCTWGSTDAPRHLYLVGDSSAMAYAPAFAKLADDSGGAWRVTTVGLYGCRFTDVLVESTDSAVNAACAQRKADVAAIIAAEPADLLVVSNAFTLGRTIDGRDLNAEDLASSVADEVRGWAPPGRTVFLSPPPHGADLARCVSALTGPAACLSAVDDVWEQMQSASEAQAAGAGDTAIDARPFSCAADVCPAFVGTTPVRYDAIHLTPAYAERLSAILGTELAGRGLL